MFLLHECRQRVPRRVRSLGNERAIRGHSRFSPSDGALPLWVALGRRRLYSDATMGQAYTPGLKVTERMLLRRRRMLPIRGEVLLRAGDKVAARDVVAQTLLPGPVTPVNVASTLSIPPGDLPAAMLKAQGDNVTAGELLARSNGMFGWFKKDCPSPAAGVVEAISSVTGQVMLRGDPLPVQLRAFLSGMIVEVFAAEGATVEAEGTFVQGIFGIGGEAFGPIQIACGEPDQRLAADLISDKMRGPWSWAAAASRPRQQHEQNCRGIGDRDRRDRRSGLARLSGIRSGCGDDRFRDGRLDVDRHRGIWRDCDGCTHARTFHFACRQRCGSDRRHADPRRRIASRDSDPLGRSSGTGCGRSARMAEI